MQVLGSSLEVESIAWCLNLLILVKNVTTGEKGVEHFLNDFQKHLRHQKGYIKQHFNDLM